MCRVCAFVVASCVCVCLSVSASVSASVSVSVFVFVSGSFEMMSKSLLGMATTAPIILSQDDFDYITCERSLCK